MFPITSHSLHGNVGDTLVIKPEINIFTYFSIDKRLYCTVSCNQCHNMRGLRRMMCFVNTLAAEEQQWWCSNDLYENDLFLVV